MKNRLRLFSVGFSSLVVAFASYVLSARAGAKTGAHPLFYSGTLEVNGKAANGEYSIALALFDAEQDGQALCPSESQRADINAGHFRIALSSACVDAVAAAGDAWVALSVTGPDGVKHDIPGRTNVGAVPFALEAGTASAASGPLQYQLVPAGAVVAFDLDECPSGWSEYEAGRGRAIVGANKTAAGELGVHARGEKFGAETVTLHAGNLPPHTHRGSTGQAVVADSTTDPYRDYNTQGCGQVGLGFMYQRDQNCLSNNWRDHTHSFVTDDGPGASTPIDSRPPSLVLLWCRKD